VWAIYRAAKPKEMPAGYSAEVWPLYYVALSFLHNRQFGIYYMLGLIIDVVLRAFKVVA
jgi:1,4-dihydroxy-2-naphthoate octaprenyltransferase